MYIRTRLALWLILILISVQIIFGVSLRVFTGSFLFRNVGSRIHQRAETVAATIDQKHTASPQVLQAQLHSFASLDEYLQIQDRQGHVLASSTNLGNRVLPLSQLKTAFSSDSVSQIHLGDTTFIVYGREVQLGVKTSGYLFIARTIETGNTALDLLGRLLFSSIILILALAGIAVWFLVRRMLHPLDRLATSASEIADASDHSLRLHVQGRSDEIGRLARTINEMLQSLEDAYRRVQDVNDLQRRFLADVSHELRTPLTIILSSLDLVKREGESDPVFRTDALEEIRTESERMARMVTQLLILARTDAGTAITREPLLLIDLLQDVCRQSLLLETGKQLTMEGFEQLEDVVVLGNTDYLKQLFVILLDNAFKYTPNRESVRIQVELKLASAKLEQDGVRTPLPKSSEEMSSEPDRVAITVADRGIGIAAEDLPRIFERFYRAENARLHMESGIGLGLAIAQHIAEQHKGTITIESTLGKGSCFTVWLPIMN